MNNKKQFFLITIFCSFLGFSQGNYAIRNIDNIGINQGFIRPIGKSNSVQGSPYIIKSFHSAKVENVTQNSLMRYNASSDEFEFISPKGDTLVLNKTQDFGDIFYQYNKHHYQLTTYFEKNDKSNFGYLLNLYKKNSFTLYKREKIKFYEAKVASTPYETDTQARYERDKDVYFIKIDENEIHELPSSKKNIFKMFPEKKTALESFFKQNEIDLGNEKDVIKLVDFLAQ